MAEPAQASPSKKILKSIFKTPKVQSPQTKRASRSSTILANFPPQAPLSPMPNENRSTEVYSGFGMPIELLMTILDYVRDDKETIRRCCVVCRSWLPCVRHFLISNEYTVNERNMRRLFALLASPYATIGSYISHLKIQTRQISVFLDQSTALVPDDAGARWMRPALDICACLRYIQPRTACTLRALTVRDIGSLSLTDFGELVPLLHTFAALTRLELSHCLFPTLSSLFAVVCARPTLQRLALTNILVQDEDPAAPEPWLPAPHMRLPRRLAHLTVQTAHQSDILLWLLAQQEIPALSSVSLGGIGQTQWDRGVTNRFLGELGPHLRSLKLYLSSWKEVTLAHNTNLQSLSISRYSLVGEKDPDGSVTFDTFPGLLNMLEQLAAPQIAHVSLRFINNPDDLDCVPWGHIGRLFRDPKFEALRTLRIRCVGRREVMERLVCISFPTLARRGILRFQCDSESDTGL